MRLFINDIELDLPENIRIARTKQVNNINSLKNRQSNYTQRIKVPKTKNNIKALDHLFSLGNTSRTPYKRNKADFINDSGVYEIKNGNAVIFDSTKDYYSIAIYDGYVSFAKAIENFSLTDLDVSELNHIKNLTNVIETFTNDSLNYRYNVADYNGKATYGADIINIDYLIPSVRKSFLWDKIFDYFGFTYSGSVFQTEDFLNNWMTYPKPIGDGTQVTNLIHTWNWTGTTTFTNPEGSLNVFYSDFFTHNPVLNNSDATSSPQGTDNSPEGNLITVTQAGLYKFDLDGVINLQGSQGQNTNSYIYIRHGSFSGAFDYTEVIVNSNYVYGENFSNTVYLQLEAGESFMIGGARPFFSNINSEFYTGAVDIDFSLVEGNSVDFEEALLDISVTDFVNEILWEFSLTPFADSGNNIKFLTHEEWLQSINNYNYSSDNGKFISKEKEKYILSNYAQENYLRHKYNEENSDYNDGSLKILNENLKETATIIQSKIYSPERNKTVVALNQTDVFKIWDKEIKDDGTVEYKELEKRYYFMRSNFVQNTSTFGSEVEGLTQSVTGYYLASHDRLSFKEIVTNRYAPLYSILNSSKISTNQIYYNDIDIVDIDFSKLVYIKDLGSYFINNKISNYSGKGVYKTELIEVDYNTVTSEIIPPPPSIFIISLGSDSGILTYFTYFNYNPTAATIYAKQLDDSPANSPGYTGLEYTQAIATTSGQVTQPLPDPIGTANGWYEIQVIDSDGLESNIEYVFISEGVLTASITLNFEFIGSNFQQHERNIVYRFNNFTPSSASISIQQANFNTGGGQGQVFTETLTSLTADTNHTQQVTIPPNLGWIYVVLTTDTINYTSTYLLF